MRQLAGLERPPAGVAVQRLARDHDGRVIAEVLGVNPQCLALVPERLAHVPACRTLEHEQLVRLRVAEGPELVLACEHEVDRVHRHVGGDPADSGGDPGTEPPPFARISLVTSAK